MLKKLSETLFSVFLLVTNVLSLLLCFRSGEARRSLRHVSESRHQDRQQGEAQRVGADEGTPPVCVCVGVFAQALRVFQGCFRKNILAFGSFLAVRCLAVLRRMCVSRLK